MTWEPLEGTKREWGEGMVEKKVAITQDETVSIVCHESVAQYAQVNGMVTREWIGLTEEDIKDIEGWVEFKEAGSNERVPLGKLALYISHKIREKNE